MVSRSIEGYGEIRRMEVAAWEKVSDYCITNGRHNVCRVFIGGAEWYERWRVNRRPHRLEGRFVTAEEAKRDEAYLPRC